MNDDWLDRLIAWAETAPDGAEWTIPHYTLPEVLALKDLDIQVAESYIERIRLSELARAQAKADLIAEGLATGNYVGGYESPAEQDGAIALAAWRLFESFGTAEDPAD